MNFPFFRLKPDRIDVLAGLRDQIIELGTHLRFMEADRLVPQPRSADGRFLSKRELVRKALDEAVSSLTDEEKSAARKRAELGFVSRDERRLSA